MEIEFNQETVKKPLFWAIIVPFLLLVVTIVLAARTADAKKSAQIKLNQAKNIEKTAKTIENFRRQASLSSSPQILSLPYFNSITSARECAVQAEISLSNINRLSVGTPKKQQDGSFLYRETYNIKNVKLLDIAEFIDYAERNYESVRCSQVTINHSRNKGKDTWDANIDLQYLISPRVLRGETADRE